MNATTHRVEVSHLRSGAWGATCACGWVPRISPTRDEILHAARGHAEGVTVVDREEPGGTPGRRRHERLRAEMIRGGSGSSLLFRAVCSCGWRSEPVSMGQVVVVWERHADGTD